MRCLADVRVLAETSVLVVSLLQVACAGRAEPTSAEPEVPRTVVQHDVYTAGMTALDEDDPARAVALLGRYLADDPDGSNAGSAHLLLARAHERLGDFTAAARAYQLWIDRFARTDRELAFEVHARKGACEAELEQFERSAQSFADALSAVGSDALPSERVELLARRGYALFEAGLFDEADEVLAAAEKVVEANERDGTERFADFYFVGMTRFYRAAIIHVRFREIRIELPEAKMARDFERKLALLVAAQDAYNHTIASKHVFWVSASGFQLGSLFGEFHDALMYAPVPSWLGDEQRRVYYDELKKQLRPVVNKAVWVFEKNLETARKLGYHNDFVDRTEQSLAELQAVLLAGDATLGQPNPRLAPVAGELDPDLASGPISPADAKLFVPFPTPL